MQCGAKFVFNFYQNMLLKLLLKMVKNPPYLAFTSQFKIYVKFLVGP
jgi:hypothetical protein